MLVAIALDRPLADAQAFVGSEIYEFSEAQKALLLLLRTENFFFSSRLADCRSEARSLHENRLSERHLYKDTVGP